MKLDCVLTSCNLNEDYLDFVPLFINAWKKVNHKVEVKVILIADEIPNHLESFENEIILFPPIENVSTAFTSQYIRLLYPAILENKSGVLITDVDMMPMQPKYYEDNIEAIPDNMFVSLRTVLHKYNEIPICYNVAVPKTWGDAFNINSKDDIVKRLRSVFKSTSYQDKHGGDGWSKDQIDLFQCMMTWGKENARFICLDDNETGYQRLDRNAIFFKKYSISYYLLHRRIRAKVKNGYYTDFHALKPYAVYKKFNEDIVELINQSK